jgi:hypothetical protein
LEANLIYLARPCLKITKSNAGHQWFMPVILPTQEAEIRRIVVGIQPGQIVPELLPQ